jgi:ZIP family zinc transporter
MVYVSFVEIFTKAQETLVGALGQGQGEFVTVLSFFIGMFLIILIDKFIPDVENPHVPPEELNINETDGEAIEKDELFKTGIFSALAIAIDELLPISRKYGQGHQEIYGFIAGMGLMAVSLLLF